MFQPVSWPEGKVNSITKDGSSVTDSISGK